MALDNGKKVSYKAMPEVAQQQATVVSSDDETIVLDLEGDKSLVVGQRLMISADGNHMFTKVTSLDKGLVKVRKTWSSTRSHFRVDDVVPLVVRKMGPDEPVGVSRSFSFVDSVSISPLEKSVPDVDPRVWQMLLSIHTMLGMILERLDLQSEGFHKAENTQINLSATGMAFRTKERFEPGDHLEVKMFLPSRPSLGVVLYGNVVRTEVLEKGDGEVAIQFGEMSEDLRTELNQYSLMRQREIIRSAKE